MKKEFAQYLLDKTKYDYNLIADDFSRTRSQVWQELSSLFSDLKPGEKVLDLGCGNARYYQLFKEKEVDYVGIDTSEKLIKIAQAKYPEAKLFSGDALNLPFENNSFDKVYSIAVLHHIPSKEFRLQFLKETKRVLKPKGKLILTVWKLHGKKEILLLLKYTILKIIGRSKLDFKGVFKPWAKETTRYYYWFSKRELNKLVNQSGFKVEKSGIIKKEKGKRQNIYLIAQK
jgi:ubiquinone/menaquinone biosynthesis C-methylase UbiE